MMRALAEACILTTWPRSNDIETEMEAGEAATAITGEGNDR